MLEPKCYVPQSFIVSILSLIRKLIGITVEWDSINPLHLSSFTMAEVLHILYFLPHFHGSASHVTVSIYPNITTLAGTKMRPYGGVAFNSHSHQFIFTQFFSG